MTWRHRIGLFQMIFGCVVLVWAAAVSIHAAGDGDSTNTWLPRAILFALIGVSSIGSGYFAWQAREPE